MLTEIEVRQKKLNRLALHFAQLGIVFGVIIGAFGFIGGIDVMMLELGFGMLIWGVLGYWISRRTKQLGLQIKKNTPDWERKEIMASQSRWQRWLNRWAFLTFLVLMVMFAYQLVEPLFTGSHERIKYWIGKAASLIGCALVCYRYVKKAYQTHTI